jgi:acetyltransferase-like isoleucine patch superfamily enzyme
MPLFRKHPAGEITIGKKCIFRSAERANTIGLNRRCFISASRDARIQIGDECGFSSTIISASKDIKIGSRVLCGANVTITDNDRHAVDITDRGGNKKMEGCPVIIEDDVWLSMNVVVLKGVTIGKETVVAANSVVTEDLPSAVLAGGIPAKVIKLL